MKIFIVLAIAIISYLIWFDYKQHDNIELIQIGTVIQTVCTYYQRASCRSEIEWDSGFITREDLWFPAIAGDRVKEICIPQPLPIGGCVKSIRRQE